MGLDITIKVMSPLDGSIVFDADLRQRGTCLFDALPPEVWHDITTIRDGRGIKWYELPEKDRDILYKNLQTECNEYTRLAYMLSTLIQIFPHSYIIRFEGC